ncbi:hypothetical protein JCM10207_005619 [Rhodosporidiobolus poonsookiae]
MPSHSPLPSFHNTPTHTPPRSNSPTYFGQPPSGAVAEKVALSYQRARNSTAVGPLRRCGDLFQALRIPLGASNPGGVRRELSIPVLKVLHPSRPLPLFSSRASVKRSPSLSRYDHRHPASTLLRSLLALVGTAVFFVLSTVFSLRLFRSAVRAGRDSHIPFTDPSTLIFSPTDIERIWRWEIAAGHYPSRRSTPGVPFNLPEGGGGPSTALAVNGGTGVKVENPGLPKRTEEDLRRERAVKAEVERRLRDQGAAGVGAHINVDDAATSAHGTGGVEVVPVGLGREYVPLPLAGGRESKPYPPRPAEHAALDLDAVMDHCDFAESKYVRDCLEVLRVNGGLEAPLRRGRHDAWRTTFTPVAQRGVEGGEQGVSDRMAETLERYRSDMSQVLNASASAFASLVNARQQLTLAESAAVASSSSSSSQSSSSHFAKHAPAPHFTPHASHPTADPACDPDYPRLFHIFWAGPFTDKPYSAALSFLYTQRLALSTPIGADPTRADPGLCRPQLWIWINPGPASSFPDPRAERRMRDDLSRNPWSAPLLHDRFRDVVRFRLWNTTEQLDGVSEMKGWRDMRLFNSGGVKYGTAGMGKEADDLAKRDDGSDDAHGAHDDKVAEAEREEQAGEGGGGDIVDSAEAALASAREVAANATRAEAVNASRVAAPLPTKHKDELFERVGSSANKYDRLSVVLSDMARFVLTHRFGGVYLDADTILLRDWTELFNWHGAFAYRWSRLEKYNTAVLKMQRGSAVGHFVFRTAVANGLDFHPMTVSRYTKDANLEGLLLRLPDALFDPAWLNTEYYQRDRPPQPYFKRFEDFFDTPKEINSQPVALGFDGFFKGAFSYHFHNFWWIPFDQARNFPDLGPRFHATERIARGRLLAAKLAANPSAQPPTLEGSGSGPSPTKPGEQERQARATPTLGVKQDAGYKWGDDERDFDSLRWDDESVEADDERDLPWSTVLKRTFEGFLRGETPNMYGEYISWDEAE